MTFRFSRTSFRLTRLRPRALVLLATATTTAALLPLVTPSDAAVPGRHASPVIDPNASPMSPHHGVTPADAMRPTAPVLSGAGWSVTASGNSLTIDMHRTDVVSALVYQPRRTGGGSRVTEYAIRLSTDGRHWTPPVATGTLADDTTAKTLNFAAEGTRYVRLSATTPAAGHNGWAAGTERISSSSSPAPLASAADVRLLGDPGLAAPFTALLPVDGWTVSATDEERAQANGLAANVLDGDPTTLWHSRWSPKTVRLPHALVIDMHRTTAVSALTYQPRQTGVNGRIGTYAVSTSLDGTSFDAPVASGHWKDDATVKTALFTRTVSARYVRLVALSEAGQRGPWSSAAEIRLSGPGDPSVSGSWGPVTGFPLVPVATAVLPGNKLLAWSAYAVDRYGGSNGYTQTAVMDLTTGRVTQRRVDNTGHDMFCPGIALLSDGRVLVTGGSNATRASIYDPRTDTWSSTADMNIARGYQAMTLLSNGDAFVLGGSWSGGDGPRDGEVWSAAAHTWRRLPGVRVEGAMTADPKGAYRADNHMWLHATSQGRVLQLGPSKQMNWITTDGNGSITPAGPRADSADAMNGNAVSYDIGKLLTLGGAPAYQDTPATRRAYTVDLNGGGRPTATRTGDMAAARAFSNSVVLPDGKVAVFGGQETPVPFSDAKSVMTPEIWDPATGRFTPLATMAVPRNYHSTANLLPDGRIFSGGGGLCGDCATNHLDGAVFTPPYLLNPDGSERPRPVITSTPPAHVALGSTLPVTTGSPVGAFALVRTGAATHSVDNDQRRVPLTFRQSGEGAYDLSIPSDPGVALPGTYLLFALNTDGVPSIAKVISVG
ncbi:discoidin domain-containing protein [Streptomyces sp. TLI_146]|uniref:discoidin domain-containing protein n=1 Tax=Streptomyces sp. TLI_146 TaxID=1938858 RepID=UPI000CCB057A|nr:discoidin domain-containing protein [Streptomyces sp. TLI_146]PKV89253.1 galactose oxidase [Streptomyces sp. TLI_146]